MFIGDEGVGGNWVRRVWCHWVVLQGGGGKTWSI